MNQKIILDEAQTKKFLSFFIPEAIELVSRGEEIPWIAELMKEEAQASSGS